MRAMLRLAIAAHLNRYKGETRAHGLGPRVVEPVETTARVVEPVAPGGRARRDHRPRVVQPVETSTQGGRARRDHPESRRSTYPNRDSPAHDGVCRRTGTFTYELGDARAVISTTSIPRTDLRRRHSQRVDQAADSETGSARNRQPTHANIPMAIGSQTRTCGAAASRAPLRRRQRRRAPGSR
jgi:hypothetical protein